MAKIKLPDFDNVKERYQYLRDHKKELVEFKKLEIKFTDPFDDLSISSVSGLTASKGIYSNDDSAGVLKRTIIGNTYFWLDSHDDVHLSGVFAKSIAERGKRIPHLHDHIFQLSAKVGQPISIYEKAIRWKDLGVDKDGNTEALFMDTEIRKDFNARIYDDYKNDRIDQHSVRMQYVGLDLALNDEDFKDEYKVWKSVIEKLGNRQLAEKQGYFWAVSEAKLGEISAVLIGSNELTPTLGKDFKPHSAAKQSHRTLSINMEKLINEHYKV